ncbi:MAG: DNA circularization N-terminal domain-containing protein [Pseudomonadales bacterium]|nr:DNA circularization N-terminal domain-containing protein [Pseudomonadales bacterium]
MAWRDEYRPGAFRGVLFYLKNSTRTGGRRTVLDEYPLRDEPSTQDMGRKARQFNLSMTVIGKDYMPQRDRLIAALEAFGPGTLMHPFYGELQVAVLGDYSIEESTEQGGLARITQNFVESGEKPRPDNQPVAGSLVNQSADQVQADAAAEFSDAFNVTDYAGFVADSAIETLQAATAAVGNVGGLLSGSSQFSSRYQRLTSSFQQLILAPGNLAGSLLGLVRSISASGDPLAAFRAQSALFSLGSKAKSINTVGYVTPARAQQVANQNAVYRLIERAAVSEAARLATGRPLAAVQPAVAGQTQASSPSVVTEQALANESTLSSTKVLPGLSYDNRNQAVEVRDQLLAALDQQQLDAAPERYSALAKLTATLVADLNRQATSLAPLAQYQPQITQPALLIAHRLYGDARRADEIVARNRISHPGFVQGGQVLEVLKNA